ncbi:MAG: L-alanine-DL-glutamate epimerase [Rothia sp. (in: high G+C Gram-positive bacteria)]|uniref:L-alanine-DL-glutamate epimerase n=1 Tax=Rothia sp. (in: high G+C Gram-positive bacteria) TaxID=1885016 RepID=UPI0026DF4E44|nr:L-alanine-DL-glutamate epimerase [Rothia sp. (in: high G+C Gram-positive bacteria)]MDO5750477.1 L-alanine-DL-glutamate epimerase [Rothia sp. (in: high G+C Gram-positive bacteria)]
MAKSSLTREQVAQALEPVAEHFQAQMPGYSVRTAISGAGAVAMYFESPPLSLYGVNAEGESVPRRLVGTVESAGRGLPARLEDLKFCFIAGISVAERDEEYPAIPDGLEPGARFDAEPSWVSAVQALDTVLGEDRESRLISRGGYVPGRRALGSRRIALRKHYFPAKPYLGLGTIDWCAGVRSVPVPADNVQHLVSTLIDLLRDWDGQLHSLKA